MAMEVNLEAKVSLVDRGSLEGGKVILRSWQRPIEDSSTSRAAYDDLTVWRRLVCDADRWREGGFVTALCLTPG